MMYIFFILFFLPLFCFSSHPKWQFFLPCQLPLSEKAVTCLPCGMTCFLSANSVDLLEAGVRHPDVPSGTHYIQVSDRSIFIFLYHIAIHNVSNFLSQFPKFNFRLDVRAVRAFPVSRSGALIFYHSRCGRRGFSVVRR